MDLELKSRVLFGGVLTGFGSWFLVEENQKIIIFFITIIVSGFAIASYIARIRRDNTARRIQQYEQLNKLIKKDEE